MGGETTTNKFATNAAILGDRIRPTQFCRTIGLPLAVVVVSGVTPIVVAVDMSISVAVSSVPAEIDGGTVGTAAEKSVALLPTDDDCPVWNTLSIGVTVATVVVPAVASVALTGVGDVTDVMSVAAVSTEVAATTTDFRKMCVIDTKREPWSIG